MTAAHSTARAKIQRLFQIAVELRNGKAFSITRLTTIKSLCHDVASARQFAHYIAKRAQANMESQDTPTHMAANEWSIFKDVVATAINYLENSLKEPRPAQELELQELFRTIHGLQDTYDNQQWGPVRIIVCSEALVVEHALRCFLSSSEAPYWAYRLARAYAEKYDSRYGNGLVPKSAPVIEEIAEFWSSYYSREGIG